MKGIKFAFETLKNNVIKDVSALGGLLFYNILSIYYLLTDITIALKLAYAVTLLFIIVYAIKFVYFKKRPDVKDAGQSLLERMENSSFPSVHAARAGILFIALFYQATLAILVLGIILLLGVAISRVLLKRHYTTDVIAGVILGLGIGYIFFVM
jgi:undecaprenyl-diphosphatase